MRANPEITVFEELDPVIEQNLIFLSGKHGIPCKIHGKLDKSVPEAGELTVEIIKEIIKKAFANGVVSTGSTTADATSTTADATLTTANAAPATAEERTALAGTDSPDLPIRPPVLCAGCPHRGAFYAVKQAMKGKKTAYCGDIGCYTLGNAKPLDMTDTCLCMGADITMAQGFYHNEPDRYCFSFIGDSPFFASGITGVVNAVYNQAKQTICILDNSTTAMTGHQPHPGTGLTMMGEIVGKISIEKILDAIGVKPIITVNPFDQKAAEDAVKQASEAPGVSAIIFKAPCIAIAQKVGWEKPHALNVDKAKCIGCRKCINELGRPALSVSQMVSTGSTTGKGKQLVEIDKSLCTGCSLCKQVCPVQAIV
jgi:indolepyruvate ferredoxin oxidoreductase alpha subunit